MIQSQVVWSAQVYSDRAGYMNQVQRRSIEYSKTLLLLSKFTMSKVSGGKGIKAILSYSYFSDLSLFTGPSFIANLSFDTKNLSQNIWSCKSDFIR